MNKFIKKFTVAFFALLFSISVYGGELTDLKKERQEVQKNADSAGGMLKEVRAEKNTLLAEIDQLDDELTAVTEDLTFVEGQIVETEQLIGKTEIELASAESKRSSQYESYKKRVRYMYINGSVGYLDVILKSEDMTDLLNRAQYVTRIAESDKLLVAKLQETENLIGEKLEEINKSKREMVFLSGQYELKYADLESAKLKKAQLVEKLSADEALYLQQIKDLEEDSNRIEKLIKDAEAEIARKLAEERARAVSVYQGGKISWPVPSSGNITSPYGNRIHPINGRTEFHTGIDISANYGADIVAAEGGIVLSAGWNGGYGNTVVINHGNGLSTLYAHGSKLVVSAGESVSKGQVIAKAGSTGYSTGNHLHFEVRLSGKHTNPISYVRG